MTFHPNLVIGKLWKVYPDIAARDADSASQTSYHVNHIVRVNNPKSFYSLVSVGPPVWKEELAGSGSGASFDPSGLITSITANANQTATHEADATVHVNAADKAKLHDGSAQDTALATHVGDAAAHAGASYDDTAITARVTTLEALDHGQLHDPGPQDLAIAANTAAVGVETTRAIAEEARVQGELNTQEAKQNTHEQSLARPHLPAGGTLGQGPVIQADNTLAWSDTAVFGQFTGSWDVGAQAGLPAPVNATGDWWYIQGVTQAEEDAGGKVWNTLTVNNGDILAALDTSGTNFSHVKHPIAPDTIPTRHYSADGLISDEDQIAIFDVGAEEMTIPASVVDRRIAYAKTHLGAVTIASISEEFTGETGTSRDQTLDIDDGFRFGTLLGRGGGLGWSNFALSDTLIPETWIRFADEQKHVAVINKNYTIPDNMVTVQQQIQIPDAATVPIDSVIKLRNIDQYNLSINVPAFVDFDLFGPPIGTPTASSVGGFSSGIYSLGNDSTGAPAAGKMEVWTLMSTATDWIVGYEIADVPASTLPRHLGTYVLDAASSATVTATETLTKQGLLATRAVGDNQQVAAFNLTIKQTTVIDLYILKASIDAANPPAFSIRGSSPPSFCYRKPNPITGVLETDATAADTNCLLDIQQFHDLGDQWFYRLKYTFTDISGFTAYRFNILPSGITTTSPSASVEFSFRAYDPLSILGASEDVLIDIEGVNNTLYPFSGSITWGQVKAIYSYLRITGNLSKSGTAYIRPWSMIIDLGSSAAAIGQSGYAMEFADINGVFIFANSPSDTDTGLTYRQTGGDGPGGNGRMQFKVVGVKR